jgi:hypothetical protein
VDANVTAGRILEVLHKLDQAAFDRCRIVPLPPQRCGRCDVLCDVVDERGERLDLAAWPELRPLVIAATAENDRVLGGDDSGEVGIHRLIPVDDELVRVLGYAIEGQQLVQHHLAHAYSSG